VPTGGALHPRHRLSATCVAVFLLFGAAAAAALAAQDGTDTPGNVGGSPQAPAFVSATPGTTPPETTITSGPSGAVLPSQVTFGFSSSEAGSTFECRFDGWARWHPCTSPASFPNLDGGARTFSVRAVDAAGNADPTPAQREFIVATPWPNTTITSGPSGAVTSSQVTFGFSSSEGGSTFECRFDGWWSWQPCTSPASFPNLDGGARTFYVRAVDAAGNVDPTPAQRAFVVGIPSTTGYPSLTQVDVNGGFDPGCQLLGGIGGWQEDDSGTDYPGTTTIERNIVGEGSCAAKFFGRAGDRTRAELQFRSPIASANPEFTYEFLTYIPRGAGYPSEGTTLIQTKNPKDPATDTGCYGGGVSFGNHGHGTFSPNGLMLTTVFQCTSHQPDGQRNFQLIDQAPLDQWFAVKVHEKFADDGSGFVEAWYDDDGPGPDPYTQVLPRTYGDNLPVSSEPYVKIRQGSYRPATNHDTWIYGDGFRLTCQRC
jgi:polysaccharide lyase-like protein